MALLFPIPKVMALGPPAWDIIFLAIYCPKIAKIAMGRITLRKKLSSGDISPVMFRVKVAPAV